MGKKSVLGLLILIFIVGINTRTSGTLHGAFAFTFDQGRDLLVIKEMVDQRSVRLIGPPVGEIEGMFHGVWWYWLLLPLYLVFRGNPQLILLAFNIINAGAIIIVFFFGKAVKNDYLGLIFASLIAVSPNFISTSAQLWNPNLVPLLVIIYLFILWKFLQKQITLPWLSCILGLIIEFHIGYGSMLLIATLLTLTLYKKWPDIREILISFMTFGIWIIPRLIFEFRHNFLQTKSFLQYIFHQQAIHTSLPLLNRLLDRVAAMWGIFLNAFAYGNTFVGIIILCILVAYLYSIFIKPKNQKFSKERFYLKVLMTIILGIFICTIIYPNILWNYYLIGFPALIVPFIALSIYWLISKYHKLGTIFAIILVIYNFAPWGFFSPFWAGDASVYRNQIKTIDAIYKQAQGKIFNVSVYSPSLIDYNYEYLFGWYGLKNYGYMPDRNNELSMIFFIIEPDPWNKGLRTVWIKDREGDGKIIWQQKFNGDIFVQQRIRVNTN